MTEWIDFQNISANRWGSYTRRKELKFLTF